MTTAVEPKIREYPDYTIDEDGNEIGVADTCSVFVTYEPFPHVQVRTTLHDVPYGARPKPDQSVWWVEYEFTNPNVHCRVNWDGLTLVQANRLAVRAAQCLPEKLAVNPHIRLAELSMTARRALSIEGLEAAT